MSDTPTSARETPVRDRLERPIVEDRPVTQRISRPPYQVRMEDQRRRAFERCVQLNRNCCCSIYYYVNQTLYNWVIWKVDGCDITLHEVPGGGG